MTRPSQKEEETGELRIQKDAQLVSDLKRARELTGIRGDADVARHAVRMLVAEHERRAK